MHGRSLIAALAVAAPVLLFGAFVFPPAFAQERPCGGRGRRSECGRDRPCRSADAPRLTPPCRRPPIRRRRPRLRPANPHQLPASPASHKFRPSTFRRRVRRWLKPSATKLADPALRQAASAGDLAALGGLLQFARRSGLDDRHGLLQRSAGRHRRSAERRRLGSFQRGVRSAFRRRSAGLGGRAGAERDQARPRHSEICASCARRQDRSRQAQECRHDADLPRSEDRVGRDRRYAAARRLSPVAASQA